jgi:LacI family transcriptional regulator
MSNRGRKTDSVTIMDVARAAGVSYSTVSRVINNYEHIRLETREKVLNAITRLGYVVNQQARSLAGGRSQVVGLLVPDVGNTYIGMVMRGIDAELVYAQYDLMLYTTHHRHLKESLYVGTLTRGMTDGLLLLVPQNSETYIKSLHERQFPYVVIDHQGFDDYSSTVVATNWQGAFDATEYLISLGHRRLGHIAGDQRLSAGVDRLSGYRAALEKHHIPFDAALVAEGHFQQADSYAAANALLDLEGPPTAIFAASDMSAFGAAEAIRDHGLRIPDDISIAGFDDIPEAAYMHPALTTVRQPLYDMGRLATRMLLQAIAAGELPSGRIVVDTELIIRQSCQPPRWGAVAYEGRCTGEQTNKRPQGLGKDPGQDTVAR